MGAVVRYLPDRRRLHMHHGPIDLIVDAEGPDRDLALKRGAARFQSILDGLVAELSKLRRPFTGMPFADPVAKRMARAVAPFETFVTPMAAVAGAVADEVLAAMVTGSRISKAYVNNGGDIAFHLTGNEIFRAQSAVGPVEISASDLARGLATSGWRGRSYSLGIADAVTVIARTAAEADVAATLIANAVDLPGHSGIERQPACTLSPDSDLGERHVTVNVGRLTEADVTAALERGAAFVQDCLNRNLITAATLTLCSETRVISQEEKAQIHA